MKTVHEIAKEAGISVRTLHYYDEIGLLRPAQTSPAGYRLYDTDALIRLQQILFFRELDFSLKEIREILEAPDFDPADALQKQKELLLAKRRRLDRLVRLIDQNLKEGTVMSFQEFDQDEFLRIKEKYADEAREKYGHTDAYKESQKKVASYTAKDFTVIQNEAAAIYRAFAATMDQPADAEEPQRLVRAWQDHITRYFYTCTKEMLAGLGELYVADHRFTENIDVYQPGLAAYMSKAIAAYCK